MICIANWWSGPFGRYIFIPMKDKLNTYIYIDKDIEIADSLTNKIVRGYGDLRIKTCSHS